MHEVHPVLPFDLTEASFLVTYQEGMTSADLIAARIRQLQKRPEDLAAVAEVLKKNRLKSKAQFEKRFCTRLRHTKLEPGTLVLVRNTTVEKDLDRKSKPRYLGPYQVIRQTQNSSYVLAEPDGTLWKQKVAGFRVVPYIARDDILTLRHLALDLPAEEDTPDNDNDTSSDSDSGFITASSS